MEIVQEQSPAIRPRRDDDVETNMGVTLTPMLYRMLSSGVYQNNVRAILREYLCNAYDAQVEAGRMDAEIQLFLPNSIEPNFKIRDYGTGLSEEGIRKVFGSYGNSTKTQTNAQIGCFGIGSKSAFSYTDQFTVVSYYKDTKRTFSCFLENGMPKVRRMSEADTDEPNGLEVSFPVMESGDYLRFYDEAMHVLKPFKAKGVKVAIFGTSRSTEVKDHKREVEGTNWALTREGNGLIVRMGLVDYHVDTHQLQLSSELRTIVKHGFVVTLPMGSVQPTPSRENLQIDDATRKTLNDFVQTISKELFQQLGKQIDNAASMHEARKAYHVLVADYRSPYYEFRLEIVPTWKGRPLRLTMTPDHFGFEMIRITRSQRGDKATASATPMGEIDMNTQIEEIQKNLVWEDYPNAEYRVRTYLINFGKARETLYLVRPTQGRIRIPVYNQRQLKQLRTAGNYAGTTGYIQEVRNPRTKDMKRFFEALGVGWKAFRLASSFPKKERAKPQRRMTGPDPKAKAFALKGSSGNKVNSWMEAELDIKAGGYYIPIRHWKPALPCNLYLEGEARNMLMDPGTLYELVLGAGKVLNREDVVVYGINKPVILQRLQKESNWHNIWDFLLEAFWQYQNDTSGKLHEVVNYASTYSSSAKLLSALLSPHNHLLNFIPGTHKGVISDAALMWDDLVTQVQSSQPVYTDWDRKHIIGRLTRFMEERVWAPAKVVMNVPTVEKQLGIPDLYTEYPMLSILDLGRSYDTKRRDRLVADYLIQCDTLRSCDCK